MRTTLPAVITSSYDIYENTRRHPTKSTKTLVGINTTKQLSIPSDNSDSGPMNNSRGAWTETLAGLIFTRYTEEHFFQIRISQPLVGIDTSFLAVSDGEIEYYPLVIIRTLFGCQGMRNLCVLAHEHFFLATQI